MSELHDNLTFLNELGMWEWPEGAREWIDQGLADSNPETRKMACHAACQDVDDHLAKSLLYLIRHDQAPEVVSAAAIALGPALQMWDEDREFYDVIGDLEEGGLSEDIGQEIMSELKAVYEDPERPKLVRKRCLEAAVRGPIMWQPDAISTCYQSDDSEWVQTAVFCMGFIAYFGDQIIDQLKNTDANIKREALRAAGRCSLDKAGDTIMEVASDPEAEKDLRLAALEALAGVAPKNSHALLNKLTSHEDDDIASTAEYALEERSTFDFDEEIEDW